MITLLFLGALYELSSCKSNKKFSFHKVKFNKETWSKITFEKLNNWKNMFIYKADTFAD